MVEVVNGVTGVVNYGWSGQWYNWRGKEVYANSRRNSLPASSTLPAHIETCSRGRCTNTDTQEYKMVICKQVRLRTKKQPYLKQYNKEFKKVFKIHYKDTFYFCILAHRRLIKSCTMEGD